MKMKRGILVFSVLGFSLFLSGCDMYDEGIVTRHKTQVTENEFYQDLAAEDVTPPYMAATAQEFLRYGEGAMLITVAYDPQSAGNTASVASATLSRVADGFKTQGVKNLQADILPVKQLGETGRVMISFTSYEAKGPEDCGGLMAGLEGDEVRHREDYQLGCTVENLTARQVADPRDLLGRDDMGPAGDGRRASNVIERYRTGEPNTPLEGEQASD